MTQYIPITLQGNSLGERHRYLNSLVTEAYKSSVPFDTIKYLPETSPIDKLFKIDLASKYRNVDYVIKNLKDSDLLFVARALKCKWLLETKYADIINPCYLENELFPSMTEAAINKMQHWLQHYLHDPARCYDFYKYYKESEFKKAVPFLWHCSNEYILEEFNNIIGRIEPKHLKVLTEKCPQVTKIFYERLESDNTVLKHYLDNENSFFGNLKFILKSDPETFFGVIEKYFNNQKFGPFRSVISKHIILHHKRRFADKPELYTAWLLDINVLAKNLIPEEIKDLIIKLAKAEYLQYWFSYQAVEPLIKRLEKKERVKLKNLVFVNKSFGDKIKDWQYKPPAPPVLKKAARFSIFQDKVYDPRKYYIPSDFPKKRLGRKRCIKKGKHKEVQVLNSRTLLDELFDRYRFASFELTLLELRKRLRAESSPQNRQFIMLVLVSKSGGREVSLRMLFKLLSQFKNEPVHLRATIVRSLVKRACVWRLPIDLWDALLEWGHGLGLDGNPPEAACDEGLHAVVLRSILAGEYPNSTVLESFYKNFTDFTQYSLTSAERLYLRSCLPSLLLNSAQSLSGHEKRQRLDQLLETLAAYNVRYSQYPDLINVIAAAAQEDSNESKYLLQHLFWARAGRRQLYKENFSIFQDDASYTNALRHDASILNANEFEVILKNSGIRLMFEMFFKKLVVYFCEYRGLAVQYYNVIKEYAKSNPKKSLGRSLAILAGEDLTSLLNNFDCHKNIRRPKSQQQSLVAALRANGHLSKPSLDINYYGWESAGVKAVANFISRSPSGKREEMVLKLMTWRKTLILALALTKNEDTKCNIFKKLVSSRPGMALKMFLRNLEKNQNESSVDFIWNIVKSLINELDYKNRKRLLKNLENTKSIPPKIAAEFYTLVYKAILNINKKKALPMICHVGNVCHEVEESFFYDIFKDFIENDFVEDKLFSKHSLCNNQVISYSYLYIDLIGRFLLLCSTEESQKRRFEVVGVPLLVRLESFFKVYKSNKVIRYIEVFLNSLKYYKVYFDVRYEPCEPIFEKVVSWLHNLLPIEKWFEIYAQMHLTMLHFKTARHCVMKKPDLFSNNNMKAVEMFGNVFGKFFAHAYKELELKYFQSLRVIYREVIMNYLVASFDYHNNYDESTEMFVIAFLKGVLEETEATAALFIASHLLKVHKCQYFRYDYDQTDIELRLKDTNNYELRFCVEMDNFTFSMCHKNSN